MKKVNDFTIALCATSLLFAACSNDDDNQVILEKPSVENMEIGLNNNSQGVIGRDFHFEMDVVAGDRIEDIQIHIQQRDDQVYDHQWTHEIIWDEYQGTKNTNIHKHFEIPEEAAEGDYDFLITVNDQNGTQLEELHTISIFYPENLPVDPKLQIFSMSQNSDSFYGDGEFSEANQLVNNDTLSAQATIGGVKGDGKMYMLLIKKSLNYRPETIEDIDFTKVIVYDVFEHENEEQVFSFSNAVFDIDTFTWIRKIPHLIIGDANDNSTPQPNPIDGEKQWENGKYYFGVVYKNTTYNHNFHHYIEIEMGGF